MNFNPRLTLILLLVLACNDTVYDGPRPEFSSATAIAPTDENSMKQTLNKFLRGPLNSEDLLFAVEPEYLEWLLPKTDDPANEIAQCRIVDENLPCPCEHGGAYGVRWKGTTAESGFFELAYDRCRFMGGDESSYPVEIHGGYKTEFSRAGNDLVLKSNFVQEHRFLDDITGTTEESFAMDFLMSARYINAERILSSGDDYAEYMYDTVTLSLDGTVYVTSIYEDGCDNPDVLEIQTQETLVFDVSDNVYFGSCFGYPVITRGRVTLNGMRAVFQPLQTTLTIGGQTIVHVCEDLDFGYCGE